MSRPTAVRLILFMFLATCALFSMFMSIQEQLDFAGRRSEGKVFTSKNAKILSFFGQQKYMLEADLDTAVSLFKRALISNPHYMPALLSLAEVHNDAGRKDKSLEILDYVDTSLKDVKWWRWEKALTSYQIGELDSLPKDLRFIIAEIPGKQRNAGLQLAYSLWDDPDELVSNIGEENIPFLFSFLVRKKDADKALDIWEMYDAQGNVFGERETLSFIDLLLSKRKIWQAAGVWWKSFNPEGLIYNGDFSKRLLNRAFGWRVPKHNEYRMEMEQDRISKEHSVHFRFKGRENFNFYHFYQIVPLASGRKYELQVETKTKRLTSDQRPYFEVTGFRCNTERFSSRMLESDQEWSVEGCEFSVPHECEAMVVRLRRKESRRIDNKLTGQVWLKNVVIKDLGFEHGMLNNLPDDF